MLNGDCDLKKISYPVGKVWYTLNNRCRKEW